MSALQEGDTASSTGEACVATCPPELHFEANSSHDIVFNFPFFALPREVQLRIMHLALARPFDPLWSSCRYPRNSPLTLDGDTAVNLLCSTRRLNEVVSPLIFAHIRIDRPSKLLAIYRAVMARPLRGSWIRSLHLGPDGEAAWADWPLRYNYEGDDDNAGRVLFIQAAEEWPRSSSRSTTDIFAKDPLLPRWFRSSKCFSLDGPEAGCTGKAVYDALVVAMETLDVNPYRKEYGKSGRRIGLVSRLLF